MTHKVVSLLLCIAVSYATAQTGTRCPAVPGRSETCVCQHQEGVIDMTSLANKDNTPRYSGLKDPNSFSYEYNPCSTFTAEGECSNVHVCQKSDSGETYDVADANTEQMWIDTDGTPYLYYTGLSGGQFRETYVYLHCEESSKLVVTTLGDSEPGSFLIYKFDMTGRQVCPGGYSTSGTAAGIVGIILIIFVLVGVASYFIIGAVVMKVKFQATGSDIIPNKMFWIALPGLIKEGFLFTFGPPFRFIHSKIRGGQGYEAQKDSV